MTDVQKKNICVLVIDDDLNTREFLSAELEANGYTVKMACGGKEALDIFEKDSVSVIVSDVVMPKMSGITFLEFLRKKDAEVPVIFTSGFGSVEMAVEAMKKGASDFISKPFNTSEIVARIEKSLEITKRYKTFRNQLEEMKRICEDLEQSQEHSLQSEKLATMGRLVSGMAHEINNPLTAVIGYAQLLLDTGGQDMQRQLGVIKDQAQRCGKIIQDLMLFARKPKTHLEEMNIDEAVRAAVDEAKNELEIRDVHLSLESEQKNIKMSGDPVLLKKVFSNLISNAVHALEGVKHKRRLDIRILNNNKSVIIEVQDNGPGITQENLPRVFDPFFTTKEVGKGSGLGLSLCYGLVTEHDGKIIAQSEPGQGALFTVTLPKNSVPVKANLHEAKQEEKTLQKTKKILVVEDEFFISDFVSKVLSDRGFEVTLASDGEKGWLALQSDEFDLVLCDYRIPKMNGLEIFDKCSEEKRGLQNKFVLMTASISFAEGPDEDTLRKKGILYLAKPFTGNDLMKVVNSALNIIPAFKLS